MGAVTYPDAEVQRFVEERFVPVQFNVVEQPEVMDQFNTPWTPTLIVEDAGGREHRRCQGYLDPKRFIGEMALGWAKEKIDRREFEEAKRRTEETMRLTAGDSWREAEAIYWNGVAAYKSTGDVQGLLAGWNRILDEFPDNEWARRVEFIRQPAEQKQAA
jgi:hypothetical protein